MMRNPALPRSWIPTAYLAQCFLLGASSSGLFAHPASVLWSLVAVASGAAAMFAFSHGWLLQRRLRLVDGDGITRADRKRALRLLIPLAVASWLMDGFFGTKPWGIVFNWMWPMTLGLLGSHQLGPIWDAADGVRLALPPCSRLRVALACLCSKRTMQRVFDPVIADVQAEWLEASIAGREGHALWIRIRGYWFMLRHLGAQGLVTFARALYDAWKASKP
jgi:hypothetical protein